MASPDPALNGAHVPLIKSLVLSNRSEKGKKKVWLGPVIQNKNGSKAFSFRVKSGNEFPSDDSTKGTVVKNGARCLFTNTAIPLEYIRSEGQAGRHDARLVTIVADGKPGRVYLEATDDVEDVARKAEPGWVPEMDLSDQFRHLKNYGKEGIKDLFSNRQLLVLTTLSDLVSEVRNQVKQDAIEKGLEDDGVALRDGGVGVSAYSETVSIYLSFLVDKMANHHSSSCSWNTPLEIIRGVFSRQVISIAWDYAEANPFGDSTGSYRSLHRLQVESLNALPAYSEIAKGFVVQRDAAKQDISKDKVVSTDPPYYDNIVYADLSDFFYAWIRPSLRSVYPKLLDTLVTPKEEELVAASHRHGGKKKAERFFLNGMEQAMRRLCEQAHPAFPVTIYYAYKQAEHSGAKGAIVRTGWETFLEAVIRAGFSIVGTWPMRTEFSNRMIGSRANALASSVVLVCRRREEDAPEAGLGEFLGELRRDLPKALRDLQTENIAPVDMAQAAIGPGMAIYSRYSKVVDAEGTPVPVREALARINQVLDETLAEQEGDFDQATRWALAWFEEAGFEDGKFGVAETLSKAKNAGIDHMKQAGILEAGGGRVRLLRPEEMGGPPGELQPQDIAGLSAWKTLHWLIRAFSDEGEHAAARLYRQLGAQTETARELAYRLYAICERRKQSAEAQHYNSLIQNWNRVAVLSKEMEISRTQPDMFGEED